MSIIHAAVTDGVCNEADYLAAHVDTSDISAETYETLQAAIDANAGGVLRIPEGSTTVDDTLVLPSDITIIGTGPTSELVASGDFPLLSGTDVSNVHISSVAFTSEATSPTTSLVQFDSDGVTGCSNLVIDSCYFTGGKRGLAIGDAQHVRVSYCECTGQGTTGVGIATSGGIVCTSANGLLKDVMIDSCFVHDLAGCGIYISSEDYDGDTNVDVTVMQCRVYDVEDNGIRFQCRGEESGRLQGGYTFANNVVHRAGHNAIRVNGYDFVVNGNRVIVNAANAGLEDAGGSVGGTYTVAKHGVISNNRFRMSQTGGCNCIELNAGARNIDIIGNVFRFDTECGGSTSAFIVLGGGDGSGATKSISIIGNNGYGATKYGVQLSKGSSDTQLDRILIQGNNFEGTDAAHTGYAVHNGVNHLESGTAITVNSNTITGFQAGIRSTAATGIFVGNTTTGNVGANSITATGCVIDLNL